MSPRKKEKDDERRSSKRRGILMPIENERRRGRDRRKTWQINRNSGEKERELPMARISNPSLAVADPPASPPEAEAPTATESAAPEAPPAPAAPPSKPARKKPRATQAPSRPAAPKPTVTPKTPPTATTSDPPVAKPATSKAKPKSKARPKSQTKARTTKPPTASTTKPKPRKTTPRAVSTTAETVVMEPAPAPPAPPPPPRTTDRPRRSSVAFADGDLWIGVTEEEAAELETQTRRDSHRFLKRGSQELLVTICEGPVGTLYRAWRPIGRKKKQGRFLKAHDQLFQQIGTDRGTTAEFNLAYQTIFEAYPDVRPRGRQDSGEVITVDV